MATAARAATEGRGADVALLAVGGNALIKVAMDAIRPGGRVVLFAQTQHGETPFDPAVVCMDEKTMMGSYSSSVAIHDDVRSWSSTDIAMDSIDKPDHYRFSLSSPLPQSIRIPTSGQLALKIVVQPGLVAVPPMISTFNLLIIFWFNVEREILKCSAASVWFQWQRSSGQR